MKRRRVQTPEQKKYGKKMRRRKTGLYAVLILSFLIALVISTLLFLGTYARILMPQIGRAMIQVSRLLPQLEKNEAMLRESYDQMIQSWEKVFDPESEEYANYLAERNAEYEQLVGDTLSWMNRVTKLRVGRDGFIVVIDKETNRILAHPNEDYVGRQAMPLSDLSEDDVVSIQSITSRTKAEDLDLSLKFIEPYRFANQRIQSFETLSEYCSMALYGCFIDNGDTYIVCGVPVAELFSYVLTNALVFSVFFLILIWLFVKWICLVMDSGRETARSLRPKLISYAVLACIVLAAVSWYTQILSNVTNDLKTMEKHANAAVETLNTYRGQREKLNTWLDQFYLTQCSIAAKITNQENKNELKRKDMQTLAEGLNVEYTYLFDQKGKVIVTNSPYDHFDLGDSPEDPTYEFRRLLEGVPTVIKPPVTDDAGRPAEPAQRQYGPGQSDHRSAGIRDRRGQGNAEYCRDHGPRLSGGVYREPGDQQGKPHREFQRLPENRRNAVLRRRQRVRRSVSAADRSPHGKYGQPDHGASADAAGGDHPGDHHPDDAASLSAGCGGAQADGRRFTGSGRRHRRPGGHGRQRPRTLFRHFRSLKRPGEEGPGGALGDEAPARAGADPGAAHSQDRIQAAAAVLPVRSAARALYRHGPERKGRRTEQSGLHYLRKLAEGSEYLRADVLPLPAVRDVYVAVVLINRILYLIARVSNMRVETVCLLLRNALKYICVLIFVYYGLAQFGVDTRTLLASAGILSLMISFGAKDLVSDIIAGFFTLFEGSYKVGDFVRVGSWDGTVTEIGLRTTKVRMNTETKIFNNSSMRDIINSDAVARLILNMPISYDADLPTVEAVLNEELPKLVIPGMVKPPFYAGVQSFEDSSILLRIFFDVNSDDRFPAMRALNREIRLIFDRRGIEIPFNQIVVHETEDLSQRDR